MEHTNEIKQRLEKAVELHRNGNLDQSEFLYKEILAIEPTNKYALNFLGCIKRHKRNFDEAVELLNKAVDSDPSDWTIYYNLGNVFRDEGRWLEAIDCYIKSLSINASDISALINLGTCQRQVGDLLNAETSIKRAISLDAQSPEIKFLMAEIFAARKKYREAINEYQSCINAGISVGKASLHLARLHSSIGNISQAIHCFYESLKAEPFLIEAYFELAILLTKCNRLKEACSVYKTLELLEGNSFFEEPLKFGHGNLIVDNTKKKARGSLFNLISMQENLQGSENVHNSPTRHKSFIGEYYPQPQIARHRAAKNYQEQESREYSNLGHKFEKNFLKKRFCDEIISLFLHSAPTSVGLISYLKDNEILDKVIDRLSDVTGLSHIIWNCLLYSKDAKDVNLSDSWHYDNHCPSQIQRLIIYLNSQIDEQGGTQVIDLEKSLEISTLNNYMGYAQDRNSLPPSLSAIDRNYCAENSYVHTFFPANAGDSLWFCPSKVLHRGLAPKKGMRHVLILSLLPIDTDNAFTKKTAVSQSEAILMKRSRTGQVDDYCPYWILN